MKRNIIQVDASDNELILVAYTTNEPYNSYIVGHILNGNFHLVKVELNIEAGEYHQPVTIDGVRKNVQEVLTVNLPPRNYVLTAVGINWGGPAKFYAKMNNTPLGPHGNENLNGPGVVWTPTVVPFTVTG